MLAERLGELLGADVADLDRLSGGASRETWRLTSNGRRLIAQVQRRGDVRNMGVEVAVLRAAFAAGVPVPEVIAADTDVDSAGGDGQPAVMVLSHVEGETIARKILRDQQFSRARQALTAQCASALARLHGAPVDSAPGLVATDQLVQYRDTLDALGQPHPVFEMAFRWLADNRPAARPQVIVHGDFRLGNLMIDQHGLAAVLDWELAHIGDPMEDLGWLCVKAWRFGSSLPVAGVGEYDELCAAYDAAGGGHADPADVHWWEVLGTLKWGIMCILQTNAHLSGMSRSHELAAIGRRVCENEHDLLVALEGRW
jgi:aminoglycoside phosphotransferase (APT) family kinase protein